jgi:predicted PurR-regulated permease PerM
MEWITRPPRWLVIGLALPLFALNAWIALLIYQYFQSLITIAVAASLLAFVLEYPVEFLESRRVPRSTAVLIVLVITLTLFTILGVTLVPTLIEQLNELAARLPVWLSSGTQQIAALQDWAEARNLPVNFENLLSQIESRVASQIQTLSGELLGVLLNAIGRAFEVVVTTILTFYLLIHGDRLWSGLVQWLPQPFGSHVRQSLRQNFQNYFAGQVTIAALLGLSMTIAFVIAKIPFGLLFGLGVGLMAIFPFGTSLGIAIVVCLTALKSIWLGVRILAIAVLIQQVIEQIVAPQLIGKFTGLNPVWILISLLLGAKLGGLLGLVVAVPIASFIKSLSEYLKAESLILSQEITDVQPS